VTIDRLLFRDADGGMHACAGPIVAGHGATASAIAGDADEVRYFDGAQGWTARLEDRGFLPRGAWIARLEASSMTDACGLEYEEVLKDHIVMGVIDMAEAR
jgi:hypothetical protein